MTTTSTKVSLFRSGFKAEEFWGDVITAHHMNTRSVYRLKKNGDVAVTHTATYEGDDIFTVSFTEVTAYHPSGNVLSSTTKTLDVFDNFNDAFGYATLWHEGYANWLVFPLLFFSLSFQNVSLHYTRKSHLFHN